MSSWWLSLGTTAVALGLPALAHAQQPQRPQGPPQAAPSVVHRDPAAEAIGVGRTRMAKGDYAGALEAFDAAMRTSFDPQVRRDRGLCHEQLGHPFPAIDDFRYYLTALPDAPDAEDIRNRLNQLETANGFGGTGTGGSTAQGTTPGRNNDDPFAVDTKDPNARAATEPVAGTGERERAGNYDQELAENERWDEAESSPMRRGSGLSIGVFGRGFAGLTQGISGYGAGATLRGALGGVSTIYGEFGYVSYRAGDPLTGEREGGISLGLGYEARFRLDQLASNAIILAGVVNYERVTDSNSQAVFNVIDPRAKLGYRHVFGPGLGLEIGAEVAQPLYLESGALTATTFGGTLALLVGF
jgi:tetratricopeptide (TPR) repeat protein